MSCGQIPTNFHETSLECHIPNVPDREQNPSLSGNIGLQELTIAVIKSIGITSINFSTKPFQQATSSHQDHPSFHERGKYTVTLKKTDLADVFNSSLSMSTNTRSLVIHILGAPYSFAKPNVDYPASSGSYIYSTSLLLPLPWAAAFEFFLYLICFMLCLMYSIMRNLSYPASLPIDWHIVMVTFGCRLCLEECRIQGPGSVIAGSVL